MDDMPVNVGCETSRGNVQADSPYTTTYQGVAVAVLIWALRRWITGCWRVSVWALYCPAKQNDTKSSNKVPHRMVLLLRCFALKEFQYDW